MGVMFSFLDFIDIVYKQNAFCDPVVALGSLNINETAEVTREFASKNQWWRPDDTNSVRSLLKDRYNILNYKDIDINGRADIWLDLNKPLDITFYNSANVILNGGTLEHVFDVAQAIKNIHGMLRERGTVIHLLPVSWFNHGYYNFNPLLFMEIARVNNYQLLAEAFYCNPDNLEYASNGTPINYSKQNSPAITYITFDGTKDTEEKKQISSSFNKAVFPSNLLYMVAYKKNNLNEFVYPVDDPDTLIPRISAFDASQAISLNIPFIKEIGFAWSASLNEYMSNADDMDNPYRSKLILLEDGKPLWHRHIMHSEIREIGLGRYSHWRNGLIFSTSDNTDPNTNGRSYQIVFTESAC